MDNLNDLDRNYWKLSRTQTWSASDAREMAFVGIGDAVRAAHLFLVVGADHLWAGRRFDGTFLEVHDRDQVVAGQRESNNWPNELDKNTH